MSAVSYYTAEGLKKLREELDYLKNELESGSINLEETKNNKLVELINKRL